VKVFEKSLNCKLRSLKIAFWQWCYFWRLAFCKMLDHESGIRWWCQSASCWWNHLL